MRVLALIIALPIAACSRSQAAPTADPLLIEPIASLVTHPRCINCHQDDSPRQTDEKIRHQPLVTPGADGFGAPSQPCQRCHQATNTAECFVPGLPTWQLAPLSRLLEGR